MSRIRILYTFNASRASFRALSSSSRTRVGYRLRQQGALGDARAGFDLRQVDNWPSQQVVGEQRRDGVHHHRTEDLVYPQPGLERA